MILIVRKNSTFDRGGAYISEKVREGWIAPENLARIQKAHDEHYRTLDKVTSALSGAGIPFKEVARGEPWPELTSIKYVITVGGDGTVLEASHHLDQRQIGLIGVKSSPSSVGHLCYVADNNIQTLVREIQEGTVKFLQVARLKASIQSASLKKNFETKIVLNDFLYAAANPAETTRYKLSQGSVAERQKSSGIWISTAAGSTAAISAAGGERFPLNSHQFQYLVREPFAPASDFPKLIRGTFNPDSETFEIENLVDQAILALDGHHGMIHLGYGDKIRFMDGPSLTLAHS